MKQHIEELEHKISKIQKSIKYTFNDSDILIRALTHSSFANEHKDLNIKYNERLEFLGDSVLSIVVSDYIFDKYPNYPEGELSKLRATVVCETVLATVAKKLSLGEYLLLGKGEEVTGGRERVSILADALEALIASIYLDGGLECTRKFVLDNLSIFIEKAVEGNLITDYKTQLQEFLQRTTKEEIKYKVIKEEGPDHNKKFYVQVSVGNNVLGKGSGKSKKIAEQNAAKEALEKLGVVNE
ncbi:ribonuclease III [Caldisalinibacter kiritimatiensis]|uniref:Ribonuclease 3 n=1 Tax=Caldisalinibacter kiritimatiensis TaxID=1304284 RepID=R1CRC6_9FIRM|nr:ribonuclease III [Caldisalinibacter kiritimatiensis]EOD01236.1 Ribonuclease III [Caldisalinibacter kiritimatiensis]